MNLGAVLYRPSTYKIDLFRQQLLTVICELEKHPGKKVIMGDFNKDVFVSSTILKLMEQHGYTQHVQAATTEKEVKWHNVFKPLKNRVPSPYTKFGVNPSKIC